MMGQKEVESQVVEECTTKSIGRKRGVWKGISAKWTGRQQGNRERIWRTWTLGH